MTPEKQLVKYVLYTLISLLFAVVIPILVLELIAFYQDRKRFSFRNPATRWRLPLAGTSLFALVLAFLDGSYEWTYWPANPGGCYVSAGFITMFFVFMKQCLNFFLYDRARIVHDALQLKDWRLSALRWILWLSIAFGMHACFAWSYFVNFYGNVSEDGDCIFITRWPQVIISFAASDACLNIGMLLLFAVPLYLETQRAHGMKSSATSKIWSLMRRNMIISVIVVSCDLISLSVMTFFFFNTQPGNEALEYRILWGNTAVVSDQLIVLIGSHAMTGQWIPPGLRTRLSSKFVRCRRKRSVVEVESMTTSPVGNS